MIRALVALATGATAYGAQPHAKGHSVRADSDLLAIDVETGRWRMRAGNSLSFLSKMIARHNHDEAEPEIDAAINARLIDFEKTRSLLSLLQSDAAVLRKLQKGRLRLEEESLFLSVAAGARAEDFAQVHKVKLLGIDPWARLDLRIRASSETTKKLIEKARVRIDEMKDEMTALAAEKRDSQKAAARILKLKLLKTRVASVWRMNCRLLLNSAADSREIEGIESELKGAEREFAADQVLGGSMESRVQEFKDADALTAGNSI